MGVGLEVSAVVLDFAVVSYNRELALLTIEDIRGILAAAVSVTLSPFAGYPAEPVTMDWLLLGKSRFATVEDVDVCIFWLPDIEADDDETKFGGAPDTKNLELVGAIEGEDADAEFAPETKNLGALEATVVLEGVDEEGRNVGGGPETRKSG